MLQRVITITVILHVMVLGIATETSFLILVFLIYMLASDELRKHYDLSRVPFLIFSAVVFIFLIQFRSFQSTALFLGVAMSVFVLKAASIRNKSFAFLFVYSFLGIGAASLLILREQSAAPIIALILLLQLNDAAGYLIGKKYGKTKLFPNISPNKSLQGYIGGAIGTLFGLLLLSTVIPILHNEPFWTHILIGIFITTAGNLGDLLLSSLKRKLEIKDFSSILPGHGGILDRFDNTFFTAPLFFWLWGSLMI